MNDEKYLPLGSVVLLKGAQHCISIIGFCLVVKNENNKQYDYVGVPYPEGFLGVNSIMYFNHSGIDKILSVGFSNDEEKEFKGRLKKAVNIISKDGDPNYADEQKMKDIILKGVNNE